MLALKTMLLLWYWIFIAIRYSIKQAIQVLETIYICVVTNTSHSAKEFLIYQSILIKYN